jgi:hypothetical protein
VVFLEAVSFTRFFIALTDYTVFLTYFTETDLDLFLAASLAAFLATTFLGGIC